MKLGYGTLFTCQLSSGLGWRGGRLACPPQLNGGPASGPPGAQTAADTAALEVRPSRANSRVTAASGRGRRCHTQRRGM
jgi:hypothetical protein